MTVATDNLHIIYRGNDSAVNFPYSFRIPDPTFVKITLRDYITKLISDVLDSGDYSITGTTWDNYAGGVVTYNPGTPLSPDFEIVIERVVDFTQGLDLNNQGGFYADSLEQQLDLACMQVQEVQDVSQRSLVTPVGETSPNKTIPSVSERQGKLLGFDADGAPSMTVIEDAVTVAVEAVQDALEDDIAASEAAKAGAESARDLSRLYAISNTNAPISGAVSINDRGAKYYSGLSGTSAAASAASAALAADYVVLAGDMGGGNVEFFDTYADANAAVGGLDDLQVVEVFVDETRNDQRSFYRVESSALVYKVGYQDLTNGTADLDIHTLEVARGSAGPLVTLSNVGFAANVLEFGQTSGTVKSYVGSFSTETNISHNMKYYTGVHSYGNDSTKYAFWMALNNGGWFLQKSPPGYSGDMWDNSGQGYIASIDNLGTGNADIWTTKFPGVLRWATGNALTGTKNSLDEGTMRLTESTGVQTLDLQRTLSLATIQTNAFAGSETAMVIKTAGSTDQIKLWSGTGEVYFAFGMTVGVPSGGYKGVGTINAVAVYDDNSLLTGYVVDAGKAKLAGEDPAAAINLEKYDALNLGCEHIGARMFLARLGTEYDPLDIDKYAAYWIDKNHLTSMPNEDKIDIVQGFSTGEYVQRLVETVEIFAYHIECLNRRLKVLEGV